MSVACEGCSIITWIYRLSLDSATCHMHPLSANWNREAVQCVVAEGGADVLNVGVGADVLEVSVVARVDATWWNEPRCEVMY